MTLVPPNRRGFFFTFADGLCSTKGGCIGYILSPVLRKVDMP